MDNVVQPFVNLTQANIDTFTRFAQSKEVTELARDSLNETVGAFQRTAERLTQSKAFAEWTRAWADNYARFVHEYSQAVLGLAVQSQTFLGRQIEQGAQRVERVAQRAGEAVDRTADAAKGEAFETANEVERARARQHKS